MYPNSHLLLQLLLQHILILQVHYNFQEIQHHLRTIVALIYKLKYLFPIMRGLRYNLENQFQNNPGTIGPFGNTPATGS
jgi:hypothetical protein